MTFKNSFLALVAVASMLTLTGCGSLVGGNSEYGCKGMPDSVTCMSVGDVYQLTDGDNYKETVSDVSKRQMAGEDVQVKTVAAGGNTGPSISSGAPYVPVPQPTANPQPIRTPSQVMRVLVDPYESADGDLNVPGYVYTEIEPRRWEVGATKATTIQPIIRPMQVPVTSDSTAETTAQNSPQNIQKGRSSNQQNASRALNQRR